MAISKLRLFKCIFLFLLVDLSSGDLQYAKEFNYSRVNYEKRNNYGYFENDQRKVYSSGEFPEIYRDNAMSNESSVKVSKSQQIKIEPKQNSILQEKCGFDIPRRIIGGTTTDIDEFPWLCLLQYIDSTGNTSQDCSGVLITNQYVLTAAHCTHGLGVTTKNMKVRKVRLGEWDISTNKDCQGDACNAQVQEIEIEEIIPHEKYKPRSKAQDFDISLIRLKKKATITQFVQPICLPFGNIGNTDFEGKKLTVSGWGRTSNARNSSSNIKMKVDLPIVNRDRCRQFYQSFYGDLKISENQFCAGGEDGKDSCQGDSGGSLMTTEITGNEVKWYVIGIVSSGPAACGVQDRPSLYTNVSRFTDWILENMKS